MAKVRISYTDGSFQLVDSRRFILTDEGDLMMDSAIESSDDFRRRINPCLVPPGYRLLDPEEIIEAVDIYWHTVDLSWRKQPYPPQSSCSQKTIGVPYARPVSERYTVATNALICDHMELLLRKYCYRTGEFTLASGQKSNEYLDVRAGLLHPAIGHIIATVACRVVSEHSLHSYVAGVAVGGIPLAVLISHLTWEVGHFMPTLIIRPEPKAHGLGNEVEGLGRPHDGTFAEPTSVILVDDVLTSGGSVLRAIDRLNKAAPKLKLLGVLTVVDREQGGAEAIKKAHPDIFVVSLTTMSRVRMPK